MALIENVIFNQLSEHNNDRPETQIVEQKFRWKISRSVENTPTIPLNRVSNEKIHQA